MAARQQTTIPPQKMISVIIIIEIGCFASGFLIPHFQLIKRWSGLRQAQEGGYRDLYDKVEWQRQQGEKSRRRYQILAAPQCEKMAMKIERLHPERFHFHKSEWDKFPDGTDHIIVGGFSPRNMIAGEHVLFLASFHNNDVTLSQFQVLVMLSQSFVSSLTIVLPFYPTGTMERVTREGEIATAATYAQLFSSLPSVGKPKRLMIYDLHTLQNRFYYHGSTVASLHTTIPLLLPELVRNKIDAVAFPDDGAAKRFKSYFMSNNKNMQDMMIRDDEVDDDEYFYTPTFDIIVCGKVRDGESRVVTVQDGDPKDRRICIVDDLVQTGGTLFECGLALKNLGATSVHAFVAHAVFPKESWRRFLRGGDRDVFDIFYTTNSIPTTTNNLPKDDVFKVLDLTPLVIRDLDSI